MDRSMRSRNQTIIALQEHVYHAHSLKKARPITDTSAPRSYTPYHKALRGKAAYFEKDKQMRISLENNRLCRKIKNQMGRRRNRVHKHTPKSLNIKTRIDEKERIAHENQKLYKALAEAQPNINLFTFSKFSRETERRKSILVNKNPNEFIWTKFNNKIASSTPKRHSLFISLL